MPEPTPRETTYREPARPRRATPLERPAARPARHCGLLGSLAALAGAGALAASQLELLAIAGAGALAAVMHALHERDGRRRAGALAAFLESDEIAVEPGAWTSPDGRRRVRCARGDELVCFEHLDPDTGETLASYRAPAPVGPAPAPAEIVERRIAPLLGRAREIRCFVGLPPELGGGAVTVGAASHVILEVRRDGALLARCDARGACLADTLHPDVASALRQLEAEHDEHVGRFRPMSGAALARGGSRACWDGAGASRLAF